MTITLRSLAPAILALVLADCDAGFDHVSGLSAAGQISGSWQGAGSFQANCTAPPWQWNGGLTPPSIEMRLTQTGDEVSGEITIRIPEADTDLLVSSMSVVGLDADLVVSGTASSGGVSLYDQEGNTWDLRLTSGALAGTVTSAESPGCSGSLVSVDRGSGLPAPSVSLGR